MSNIRYVLTFLIVLCFVSAKTSLAQDTKFIFPAGCTYGKDCWAVNYVDVNPEEGAHNDFTCRYKTYDGHKGTDFGLASIAQMNEGVDVLAAANGKILRIRNGENDVLKTQDELNTLKKRNKECGNGVLIDHGNGLQTIYCHLKQNSITVKVNQTVKAGEKIAQIGQSGRTEFPHLHFGVIWEGGIIDPYTGALSTAGCNQKKESLWHIGLPMEYEHVAIFDGGFQSTVPDFEAIKRGQENPETLSVKSATFVFWAGIYNVEKGDDITLTITDPEGQIFRQQKYTVTKSRARQYYYTGRKIGHVQLKTGQYKGKIHIQRNTISNLEREKIFTVNVQ